MLCLVLRMPKFVAYLLTYFKLLLKHVIIFQEGLPPHPLNGMCSRGKVRLTFKMENDQIWIGIYRRFFLMEFARILQLLLIILGTKERTEKISMSSIKTIVNEPIEGHEEYHIIVRFLAYCSFNDSLLSVFLPLLHLFHFRVFSLVRLKRQDIGSIGYHVNMWMQ